MNLYGQIDLGAYFGAEYRIIDGEECICIPRRFNPSVTVISGHPTALFRLVETARPDSDGFTHLVVPHLPKTVAMNLPEADYIKMQQPIGRAKSLAPPAPNKEPETRPGLDASILASRPVKYEDIPL